MNWLLHNLIADLPGPLFLSFYGVAIVAVIIACYKSVRGIDRTGDLEPAEIPAKVDPYEVAYLRGGEQEVARVALESLIVRGLLERTQRGGQGPKTRAVPRQIDKGRDPEPGELTAIEVCVLKWPGFPATQREILDVARLPSKLKDQCASYQEYLTEQQLLAPAEMKSLGILLWWVGASIILGIGGYKLTVALARGHSNVAFLLIMAVIGAFSLTPACLAFPRASKRGRKYLAELAIVYGRLKSQLRATGQMLADDSLGGDQKQLLNQHVAYNSLLMAGIFGSMALADTPWSGATSRMHYGKPNTNGGGCGGGVSSGCGGGGGGGGCGGGGGGGGGCGGCGG